MVFYKIVTFFWLNFENIKIRIYGKLSFLFFPVFYFFYLWLCKEDFLQILRELNNFCCQNNFCLKIEFSTFFSETMQDKRVKVIYLNFISQFSWYFKLFDKKICPHWVGTRNSAFCWMHNKAYLMKRIVLKDIKNLLIYKNMEKTENLI